MENIKIAVEDWGLYNNGILACKWFGTESSYEEIEEYFLSLRRETEEQTGLYTEEVELFVADSEGWEFGEHDSVSNVIDIMNELEALDDDQFKAVKLFMENIQDDLELALEKVDSWICTGESSMSDVAYSYCLEAYGEMLESHLGNYVDFDAFGRDMEIEGSYFSDAEGIIWEYTE